MKLQNLKTIDQVEEFLNGTQQIYFDATSTKDERYQSVKGILQQFCYSTLKKKDKGVIVKYLIKISGYSRQQLTRMIARYARTGDLKRQQKTKNGFEKMYTEKDIKLLAQMDRRHNAPNGLMIKKLCERAHNTFKDKDFIRLSSVSVSQIYILRKSASYRKYRCHYEKTKGTKGVHIGERRKPINNGKPGYIRIDTVHQGDLDGCKGVYHINAVDEVTQFEVVASVEKISEAYLIPVLEILLEEFPFIIINFHSDNGSEYVNKTVAKLLGKLLIEFTKSRPRRSNDNALAEGKNAAIVRKIYGYTHIPQHFAKQLNQFNQAVLNPYINYHRPCLYPTVITDNKGKQKKKYSYKNMMTPYEKLVSLPEVELYLKKEITLSDLDKLSKSTSDNEAADLLQKERKKIFKTIEKDCKIPPE